ncbi:MAG: hypothetical protein WCK48_00530 [bacterium]
MEAILSYCIGGKFEVKRLKAKDLKDLRKKAKKFLKSHTTPGTSYFGSIWMGGEVISHIKKTSVGNSGTWDFPIPAKVIPPRRIWCS